MSEDTNTESEVKKECSPCVEVKNPGQTPIHKCTQFNKREWQQKLDVSVDGYYNLGMLRYPVTSPTVRENVFPTGYDG